MGTHNVKPIKSLAERKKFLFQLLNDVKALDLMVAQQLFEKSTYRIGAEQEFCIVTKNFRPSNKSLEILEKINDPQFTTEMGLFNLELNLNPRLLDGNCFQDMEEELTCLMDKAHTAAAEVNENKLVLTGILPTLKENDIIAKNLTPKIRYRAMNEAMKEIRGNEFRLVFRGIDELNVRCNSILFEAVNTSFQIHLQIPSDEIIDKYNWAQVISGPVLSVMTNSPLLLGRELRSETRIAVFQQSLDTRNKSYHLREQKARVSFENDWIRNSIVDVYKDDISRHTALMTADFEEDSMEVLERNEIPKLRALNLHNSTLYKWNRLCYGITNGKPHLRIENRYIPSGPTVKDEIANSLFWIGLMQGMPDEFKQVWKRIPFKEAKGNFINASRTGIDTCFNWFGEGISAEKLLKSTLIPIARKGLLKSNINKKDIAFYLGIIEARVEKKATGSTWMVQNYRKLKQQLTRDEANVVLTQGMYNRQMKGNPVHNWPPIKTSEGTNIENKYDILRKVMTTEILVAYRAEPLDLVKYIMNWKNIHHMPVVNKRNKLIGLITYDMVLKAGTNSNSKKLLTVDDVMTTNCMIASPETTIEEAEIMMRKDQSKSLSIVENEELIGIFTTSDLKRVLRKIRPNG